MSFKEEFDKVNKLLDENCNIQLDYENYDAFIVKSMSATNCIGESATSHQSHIAITGDQMNLFPYIYQKEFIEKNNKDLKNFFVFKAPVNIYKNNCDYLDANNGILFNDNNFKREEMCVYPRSGGEQVQLSMKNEDTPDFIRFRELIKAGDYLIILKYKDRLEYDAFTIKKADGESEFGKKSIFEYLKGHSTYVEEKDIFTENKILELNTGNTVNLVNEFRNYLTEVKNLSEGTVNTYISTLSGNIIRKLDSYPDNLNIFSIRNLNLFTKILKQIKNSENFEIINENSHNKISSALVLYEDFLSSLKLDRQRIFFGAPGTGKSYKLNCEAELYFGNNYERVTFHPNYMYGNFVGAFKPFPKISKDSDGNENETITYKYVEGPLMRVLLKALKNPYDNFLLLIEEINRANTAAVFGDFFQLLDRKGYGESEYPITTSEEVRLFIRNEISKSSDDEKAYILNKIGAQFDKLVFPENLYIWATMNSADQGVMPMDTAFKRRWDFTYIGINDALDNPEVSEEFKKYQFRITKDRIANWDDFRREVNKRLSACNVSEDKLLGPYFISKSVLESGDIDKITETIKNKVLMYLYEDAGRAFRSSLFVSEKAATFSDLCKNFDENGNAIFKNPLDLGLNQESSLKEDKVIYNNESEDNTTNLEVADNAGSYSDKQDV